MHRFFVQPDQVRSGLVVFSPPQTHQMRNVLRLRPSQGIVVLDDSGWEYVVELADVAAERASGRIVERRQARGEPATRLTLFQSMLRREKWEWVLQKGTEVGVTSFVPFVSERSLVRSTPTKPAKLARWRKIIREAAEQSGRGRLPQLVGPASLAAAIAHFPDGGRTLVATLAAGEEEQERSVRSALRALGRPSGEDKVALGLVVGPEGGLTAAEVELCRAAGGAPVTLGRRVLRAETAAIVGAALVLHEAEGLAGA